MTNTPSTNAVIFERSEYIQFLDQARENYARLAAQRAEEIEDWKNDTVARVEDVRFIRDERFNFKYGDGYDVASAVEDNRSFLKQLFNIGKGEGVTPHTRASYALVVAAAMGITPESFLEREMSGCDNNPLTYLRRYTNDIYYRTRNEWKSELDYIESTLKDFETMSIKATYVIPRETYDNYADAMATVNIEPMYTGLRVRRY
jgi:hypothetical protein